jgi:ceramide glucosyltransferase
MNAFSILLLTGALLGLIYTALSLLLLISSFRKQRSDTPSSFAPPVSVFKPLKGLDENLRQNLESFFKQQYPIYELIFGVSDHSDPAIGVVQSLNAQYPHVRAKLVVDMSREGHNPKVNNICNMVPRASYDYWVISDSNVRVDLHYLANLVNQMRDPQVGLVTSLIRGVGGKCFGAKLENLHLNSFIAASTIAVSRLSRTPVSIGKSMLLRRETVALLGGFAAFANHLMEDGLIGQQVRNLGLRTEISMHAIENVNDSLSTRDFFNRHYRWGLMRRHLNLLHYFSEILSNPIFLTLLALIAAPTSVTVLVTAVVCFTKVTLDMMIVNAVGGSVCVSSALLLPLKDLLIALVWWKPLFTNRVSWRGNHFRIGTMTTINPVRTTSSRGIRSTSSVLSRFAQKYRLTRRRLVSRGSRA